MPCSGLREFAVQSIRKRKKNGEAEAGMGQEELLPLCCLRNWWGSEVTGLVSSGRSVAN